MCAAIIAYIPSILVINKNILNRRAPAVKYDQTAAVPVVGVYGLYPVNDNISKMRAERCKIQIILKHSPRWFDDTNYI